MKSKILDNDYVKRFIIECDCGSSEHLLVFDISLEENFKDIFVHLTSNWRKPFWCKIIQSFRYLIGKEKYLDMDGIIISKKNIEDLEEVINCIKKRK